MCIRDRSIRPETQLVLNADDPLVSKFGLGRDNTVYFLSLIHI